MGEGQETLELPKTGQTRITAILTYLYHQPSTEKEAGRLLGEEQEDGDSHHHQWHRQLKAKHAALTEKSSRSPAPL